MSRLSGKNAQKHACCIIYVNKKAEENAEMEIHHN